MTDRGHGSTLADPAADLVALWSAVHDYLTCQFAIGLGDPNASPRIAQIYHDLIEEHNRIHRLHIAELEPDSSLPPLAGVHSDRG